MVYARKSIWNFFEIRTYEVLLSDYDELFETKS